MLALACLVTAFGGGGDVVTVQARSGDAVATQGQLVQLAGCVVDQSHIPHEGVPVRVLSADGRLLGSACSGRAGEFKMQVPAGAQLALQVDTEQGESMPVQTQAHDRVVEPCLLARAG